MFLEPFHFTVPGDSGQLKTQNFSGTFLQVIDVTINASGDWKFVSHNHAGHTGTPPDPLGIELWLASHSDKKLEYMGTYFPSEPEAAYAGTFWGKLKKEGD